MNRDDWRHLPFQREAAPLHLAAGDALLAGLAATGKPVLRWYTASASALIVGVGQSLAAINQHACKMAGIPIYRRSSGGTAVLMEHDLLMLDIAIPKDHALHHADVTESYRWLGELWVVALQALGVQARTVTIAEAREDSQTLDMLTRQVCFAGRSPYEVLAGGGKIVGLAQTRRRYGALLQAGIYLHWKPQRMLDLLTLQPHEREHLAQQLNTRVTGLSHHIAVGQASSLSPATQLQTAFADALATYHHGVLVDAEWHAVERETRISAVEHYGEVIDVQRCR